MERKYASRARAPLSEQHFAELKKNGYTIVEDYLEAEKCDILQKRWLRVMDHYDSGFDSTDRTTWKSANLPISTRGMQDYPPIAQQSYVWDTRLLCAPIYAALWDYKVDELVTSMDRVCFVPKTMLVRKSPSWWHLDQAKPSKWGGLYCVQGFLALEDIAPGDVALQVLKGAHRYHRKFMQHTGEEPKIDRYKLKDGDLEWYIEKGCEIALIYVKKGSFILWDSRIPHQAKRDLTFEPVHDRYVIYVSMIPRVWVSEKKLAARIKAFETGRATSHWPDEARLFAAKPRFGQTERFTFDLEKQLNHRDKKVSDTELMLKLVGY